VTGAAVIDGQDEDEWLTPYHEGRATVDEDGRYPFAVAPCVVRRLTAYKWRNTLSLFRLRPCNQLLSLAARRREPAFARLTVIKCEVMMKRLVAAALLLFPSIAQAEYFDTGNDLWGLCTDNVSGHNYLCIGMSTAYFDMMHATGYRCAVPAVDREKVRDTVLKYLTDNPDKRNLPASELAIASLKTAFQCVEPAPPQATRPAAPAPKAGKPKGGPILLTPQQ
jgi:hypothetical protein